MIPIPKQNEEIFRFLSGLTKTLQNILLSYIRNQTTALQKNSTIHQNIKNKHSYYVLKHQNNWHINITNNINNTFNQHQSSSSTPKSLFFLPCLHNVQRFRQFTTHIIKYNSTRNDNIFENYNNTIIHVSIHMMQIHVIVN